MFSFMNGEQGRKTVSLEDALVSDEREGLNLVSVMGLCRKNCEVRFLPIANGKLNWEIRKEGQVTMTGSASDGLYVF